jgi:hypothetical protein
MYVCMYCMAGTNTSVVYDEIKTLWFEANHVFRLHHCLASRKKSKPGKVYSVPEDTQFPHPFFATRISKW